MNIVYVGDCGPKPSGAPISSDQLIRKLAARGCQVSAVTPDLRDGDPDMPAFDAARPEITAIHYPVPAYFTDPFDPPPDDWEIATRRGIASVIEPLVSRSRPDLLLVRELWWPYTSDLSVAYGIPAVVLVRGNPTSAILAGVFRADLEARFLRELRKADWIVTVARHFLPGLSRLGFDRLSCIENAVDVRAFAPAPPNQALARQLAIADSDVVFLFSGQIKPIKRPFDIVHAAARALSLRADLIFLIIGEGVSREAAEALTREYGIADRFRFVPPVDNGVMPDYMSLADAVVMPSEREGLSRVYLEAQACGKTLIASDIAGAREVVIDGETGLLARKGDVEDLATKMLIAASDRGLRSRIGTCARQLVERRHDVDDAVSRYLNLLSSVVAGDTRSLQISRSS
jgi:glycosyltransferase involved in cell wall biosynthesis